MDWDDLFLLFNLNKFYPRSDRLRPFMGADFVYEIYTELVVVV